VDRVAPTSPGELHVTRPIKVFIDTDIGNDIDDAFAVAYALASDAFEVVGVATVKFAGELRARLVRKIMDVAGREAPIAVGDERIGLGEYRVEQLGQLAWARQHLPPFTPRLAPEDLLYQAASAQPGEVFVVVIGTLTNIASAFAKYPDLPELLGGLYIMGGEVRYLRREHNFANDYLAADLVLRQGRNVHLVTWEMGVWMATSPADIIARRDQDGLPGLLGTLTAASRKAEVRHYDTIPLLWLQAPQIVVSKSMKLRVETVGLYTRGMLIPVGEPMGLPLRYCTAAYVDPDDGAEVAVTLDMDFQAARVMMAKVLQAPDAFAAPATMGRVLPFGDVYNHRPPWHART
jgi:purine nucleosidase